MALSILPFCVFSALDVTLHRPKSFYTIHHFALICSLMQAVMVFCAHLCMELVREVLLLRLFAKVALSLKPRQDDTE